MKVYRVSPIWQHSPQNMFSLLTYFSKLDFEIGNICEVDFNKRKILSVVVEVLNLNDAKIEIRKGNFTTKKIEKNLDKNVEEFFNKRQFNLLKDFSEKFNLPVGEVVFALNILNQDMQDLQEFKKNKIPKILEIFPDNLSVKINGGIANKQIFKILEILRRNNKLKNLQEIIVNDFDYEKYIQYQEPYINQIELLILYLNIFELRPTLAFKSTFFGVTEKLFLDDLKEQNLFRIKNQEEKSDAKKFIYKKPEKHLQDDKVLDEEILKIIKESNEKIFIFVLTSGYQSAIFCKDCKSGYECEKCGENFSILNEQETKQVDDEEVEKFSRYLFCKNCENKKLLKDDQYLICKKCGSWGLFPFGEGGQKIYEELSFSLGAGRGEAVYFVDESKKKLSNKKLIEIVKEFLESKDKKILLGTKRVLRVLRLLEAKKYLTTVVVSMGPLGTGKSFDSDEKFIKLLSDLESVSNVIYIGKQEKEDNILERYRHKEKFVKEEAILRKIFGLPPFVQHGIIDSQFRNNKNVKKYSVQSRRGRNFKRRG